MTAKNSLHLLSEDRNLPEGEWDRFKAEYTRKQLIQMCRQRNAELQTPLHSAYYHSNSKLVIWILTHIWEDHSDTMMQIMGECDKERRTVLHYAAMFAEKDELQTIMALLMKTPDNPMTVVYGAMLVIWNAVFNAIDTDKGFWHRFSMVIPFLFFSFLWRTKLSIASLLEAADSRGMTALHFAAERDSGFVDILHQPVNEYQHNGPLSYVDRAGRHFVFYTMHTIKNCKVALSSSIAAACIGHFILEQITGQFWSRQIRNVLFLSLGAAFIQVRFAPIDLTGIVYYLRVGVFIVHGDILMIFIDFFIALFSSICADNLMVWRFQHYLLHRNFKGLTYLHKASLNVYQDINFRHPLIKSTYHKIIRSMDKHGNTSFLDYVQSRISEHHGPDILRIVCKHLNKTGHLVEKFIIPSENAGEALILYQTFNGSPDLIREGMVCMYDCSCFHLYSILLFPRR